MLFNEMKYVCEVCKHRSFSKAAQALSISQPALSLMIKKAETRLGGALFDRTQSPLVPTALGRAYYHAASNMMHIEEQFEQYLQASQECPSGTLSIGATPLFSTYVLPTLIAAYSALYPSVRIHLRELSSSALENALREGKLDLAMTHSPFDTALTESVLFQSEEIILAVPRKIAESTALRLYRMTTSYIQRGGIQGAAAVPLKLLSEYPFLLLRPGSDTRVRSDRLCREACFEPQIRLEVDHQITAYNMAAAGLGVAFVTTTLINCLPHDDRLMFFRLSGENARRDIRFYRQRNQPASVPAAAFLRMFQNDRPPARSNETNEPKLSNAIKENAR